MGTGQECLDAFYEQLYLVKEASLSQGQPLPHLRLLGRPRNKGKFITYATFLLDTLLERSPLTAITDKEIFPLFSAYDCGALFLQLREGYETNYKRRVVPVRHAALLQDPSHSAYILLQRRPAPPVIVTPSSGEVALDTSHLCQLRTTIDSTLRRTCARPTHHDTCDI